MFRITWADDRSAKLEGNDQYEGFCIDIIQELADIYHFNYIFINEPKKDYGTYNNITKEWS